MNERTCVFMLRVYVNFGFFFTLPKLFLYLTCLEDFFLNNTKLENTSSRRCLRGTRCAFNANNTIITVATLARLYHKYEGPSGCSS